MPRNMFSGKRGREQRFFFPIRTDVPFLGKLTSSLFPQGLQKNVKKEERKMRELAVQRERNRRENSISFIHFSGGRGSGGGEGRRRLLHHSLFMVFLRFLGHNYAVVPYTRARWLLFILFSHLGCKFGKRREEEGRINRRNIRRARVILASSGKIPVGRAGLYSTHFLPHIFKKEKETSNVFASIKPGSFLLFLSFPFHTCPLFPATIRR